jgi:molybdenum cofactor cytidylyltransferase
MTSGPIGILVLAAGGSSRMGRPKQLLQFNGTTLVRRAAEAALSVGRLVVVVTGASADEVATELRELPVTIVLNPNWASGMGSSIRIGVQGLIDLEPNLDALVITLCDQPGVSARILGALIDSHRVAGKLLCAASFGDAVGPPALLGREFFSELLSLPDAHGAKQILMKHPESLSRLHCPEAARDIDTPVDYESLGLPDDR